MATSSAYKLGIVISADASSVRPAVTETKTELASIGTAAAATETKMQQLVATFAGLHTGVANGNQRAWTGALADEGLAIDNLRAKYNPLFAVISRYKTAQTEIRTAHAMGALSSDEMAAALQRQRQSALATIEAIKGNVAAMALHAAEVERLKSAYDPLYAAQQRYKAGLDQIQRAREIGAVSASEAIALNLREKSSYDALVSSLNNAANARKTTVQSSVDRLTITPNRESDIGAYGRELDQLRAKYNPLFAVITQYRAAQAETRQAHLVGAISADEMTAALNRQRQAALASIDAIKGRNSRSGNGSGHNMAATNAMFQFQDIGVTAAMGMNPAMIAMQQGSQLAGGFAGMNMKQVGASLVDAFSMLLSPVSLATVAVTGLTAAAIQYAMTWSGNAKTLSQTIEEHEAQIKSLHDAYQYAGTAAEAYFQRINAGQFFQSSGNRKQLEKTVSTGSNQMLGQLGMQSTGNLFIDAYGTVPDDAQWMVHSPYKDFEAAILHLQKTAKDGKPDILGFRQMVEERWSLDRNNEGLSKTAKELLEMGTEATAAALRLEQLKEARARFMAQEAQRRAGEYSSSISSLRGIAAPQLSDRRQVEDTYATAYGNAGDRDERADALKQRDEALVRINAQEARQIQLAQIDIQLQTARDPLTRADLTAKRERIQLSGMEIDAAEAETRVAQARNQVIAEALAQSSAQISDMRADVEARRSVNDAIAAGTINAAEAQTYLQAETQLRPLIAAAAKAEGAEKQKLTEIIGQMTAGYQALAAERQREAALDMLRDQQTEAQQLQLEISLVGASEAARRRALSALQAEQDLKRQGISTESELGRAYQQNAARMTEARLELERSKEAWDSWRSAGENAISSVVDGLAKGDIKSALSGIAQASADFFKDDIKKSLSNRLLGTNYGTIEDMFSGSSSGGILSGIMGGQSVGAMNVQAAMVNIGGTGITGSDGLLGNVSRLFNAANSNAAGSGMNMSSFASAIKSIESAGSGGYSALGPITASGDRAYGAYQVMGANIPSWTKSALGYSMSPDEYLKSSSAQDAVFSKIFGGYVDKYGASGAAQAWFGGPGSVGKGGVTDMLGTSGTEYVNKFNSALGDVTLTTGSTSRSLTSFASNIGSAGSGLNQLGSGLGKFGQTLSSALAGGNTGLGSLLGSFTTAGIGIFNSSSQFQNAVMSGIGGLWSDGGYTGPGGVHEPKGIVHAGEVVWSQRDVARAGGVHVVEGMRLGRRGYASGGIVSDVAPSPLAQFGRAANSNAASRPSFGNVTVHQDLRGVNSENARQEAYEGMMQALEDYSDHALPDLVQRINERPRWRG